MQGKYACHDEFGNAEVMCLDFSQLCDGKPQCPGNEDEGLFHFTIKRLCTVKD